MINLEGVTKLYGPQGNTTPALNGIALKVNQGERIAIVGPSGSGKSTLLHILGLLTLPTGGAMWVDGARVDGLSARERSTLRNRLVGFVFQNYGLLPDLTVWENVELPLLYGKVKTKRAERIQEALESVKMVDYAKRRPGQLSGGQQQRVAIARALVTQAPIILADEPTGALDTQTGQQILDLLCGVCEQNRTLVIVTHDPRVSQRCERVLHMQDGIILKENTR